jgi:tetratricopeptide (TPR) repeat protein
MPPFQQTAEASPQYYALLKVTLQMQQFIAEELPALATDLFWNIFLPLIVTVLLSGVTLKIGLVVYSFIYPPTASELHKEALKLLETTRRPDDIKNGSSNASNSRKARAMMQAIQQSEQQAEAILRRAMKRDPTYEPAVLSLAALYAYRQRKPQEALRVLEPFQSKNNKMTTTGSCTLHLAALDAVRQDAQAMVQGHDNMVQTELAEAEYLTMLATRAR